MLFTIQWAGFITKVNRMNKILLALNYLGINPRMLWSTLSGLPWFFSDLRKLKRELKGTKDFPISRLYPILTNKYQEGGTTEGHYFHQDLFVAQRIYINNPVKHVDIASRIDGFVAHVAAYREIEIFDIRPVNTQVKNIVFKTVDLMDPENGYHNYADSISCLHAIEHFGLGRYNDPIDADGHTKGLDNIYKMLKSGGTFYFSTPVGPQRIEFNAHRVFSMEYLMGLFKDKYEIKDFAYVDNFGHMHTEAPLTPANIKSNFGCTYGCGIFEMVKK